MSQTIGTWNPEATGFTLTQIENFDEDTTDPQERQAIRSQGLIILRRIIKTK